LADAMTLRPTPTYPCRRSYVLKLRRDASADALVGRLENLVTGRQWEFSSAAELLRSIVGDLPSSIDERLAEPRRP
jgi:hypothetical protein